MRWVCVEVLPTRARLARAAPNNLSVRAPRLKASPEKGTGAACRAITRTVVSFRVGLRGKVFDGWVSADAVFRRDLRLDRAVNISDHDRTRCLGVGKGGGGKPAVISVSKQRRPKDNCGVVHGIGQMIMQCDKCCSGVAAVQKGRSSYGAGGLFWHRIWLAKPPGLPGNWPAAAGRRAHRNSQPQHRRTNNTSKAVPRSSQSCFMDLQCPHLLMPNG